MSTTEVGKHKCASASRGMASRWLFAHENLPSRFRRMNADYPAQPDTDQQIVSRKKSTAQRYGSAGKGGVWPVRPPQSGPQPANCRNIRLGALTPRTWRTNGVAEVPPLRSQTSPTGSLSTPRSDRAPPQCSASRKDPRHIGVRAQKLDPAQEDRARQSRGPRDVSAGYHPGIYCVQHSSGLGLKRHACLQASPKSVLLF